MNSFRVGNWTVEPELGRVRSGESEVSLQPQVMQLLEFMAAHPGEVISIERMIEAVWAGKPMTSGSVYNALNTLRKTFGDSKDDPRYIETIPRRGYRLVAEVSARSAGDSSVRPADTIPGSAGPRPPGVLKWLTPRTAIAVAAGSLLVAAGVLFWPGSPNQESAPVPASAPAPQKSVAVLPFADMSPEGDQQYFAEGIADEILNLISRHPDLKVVGRSSSFQFRGGAADLREVGRKLGVANVLEGSVRRDGDRLRVTAQLIETAGGYHLWSESYDTEAGDVFRVQDEIAGRIAEQLQLAVLGEAAAANSASRRAPSDLGAHDLYLLARYRVNQGGDENALQAIDYLEQALRIDPNYALAHVELAYAMLAAPKKDREEFQKWMNPGGSIDQQAQMALAIEPNLAGAYAVLATVNYIRAWNGVFLPESADNAQRYFSRALELNPNDARALLWYSGLRRFQGHPVIEAIQLTERAIELEPLLEFAAEYYLGLIGSMPDFRGPKRQLMERITSGSMGWASGAGIALVEGWLSDGALAEAMVALNSGSYAIKSQVESYDFDIKFFLGEVLQAVRVLTEEKPTMLRIQGGLFSMLANRDNAAVCSESPDVRMMATDIFQECANNYLLAGRPEAAESFLSGRLPADEAEYLLKFRHTFERWRSVEMSLATLASLRGNEEELQLRTRRIESFLDRFYQDQRTVGWEALTTRALLYALRDQKESAIEALGKAIEWGQRDWRVFMHPAFRDLHAEPAFMAVLKRWQDLVNEDRAKLDLPPLELNFSVGPGALPFVVDQDDLKAALRNQGRSRTASDEAL